MSQNEVAPKNWNRQGTDSQGASRWNEPHWNPERQRNTLPSRTLRDDSLLFEALCIDCGDLLQLYLEKDSFVDIHWNIADKWL